MWGAYEKSRAVAVGENYYAPLFARVLISSRFSLSLKIPETVGGYYKPVDKGGQLDFVVFSLHDDGLFKLYHTVFPSKFQTA